MRSFFSWFLFFLLAGGLGAAEAGQITGATACASQVFDDGLDTIDCTVTYSLDDTERGWLAALTIGRYRDATCQLRLSLDRRFVFETLTTGGTVEFPPQDVSCDAATRSEPRRITLKVSPTVHFDDRRVISADPNVRITDGFGGRIFRGLISRIVNGSSRVETLIVTTMNEVLQ